MFEGKGPAIVAGMPERIVVPGSDEVRTKEFVQGSAMILVMMEMSRQETAEWVIGTLYAYAKRGGTVADAETGHLEEPTDFGVMAT